MSNLVGELILDCFDEIQDKALDMKDEADFFVTGLR